MEKSNSNDDMFSMTAEFLNVNFVVSMSISEINTVPENGLRPISNVINIDDSERLENYILKSCPTHFSANQVNDIRKNCARKWFTTPQKEMEC
uniref:Uncharacterized protein n=1 Tax=Romanomermis culicivorax TaxID=13658 RepID=A0A915JAP9_ROMCU